VVPAHSKILAFFFPFLACVADCPEAPVRFGCTKETVAADAAVWVEQTVV
jgi:hypothetical protein